MSSPPPPPIDPVVVNAVLIAVRQAANVLCDRWTLLILLAAHGGVTRFAEFRERCGVASRLLSSRLTMLESQEVMVRLAYTRRPLRHGYHLSHMGLALFDVFAALLRWEQRWFPGADGPGLLIEHRCGAAAVAPVLHCAACGQAATPRDSVLRISQKEIRRMPARPTTYRRSTMSAAAGGASAQKVPLPHALEIFGDKWSIEVVMCAFVGVASFGEMQLDTGMSSNILADRLQRLVASGILCQAPAQGSRKAGYRLSEAGLDLFTILVCIEAWADAWLRERLRSPLRLTHRACGHRLQPQLCCDACGQPLLREDCRIESGPAEGR
jgi:DNA-binding HxlR family transcriptional regulator